ncbi:MAG TPA: hypothetical protein DIS79_00060 [Bacteroidetes bacterium]|nr:hypothetical protein [Bacteroidota bacterium]HRK04264.1 hypothetical protein [Chlorobiota bacterium]
MNSSDELLRKTFSQIPAPTVSDELLDAVNLGLRESARRRRQLRSFDIVLYAGIFIGAVAIVLFVHFLSPDVRTLPAIASVASLCFIAALMVAISKRTI